MSKTTPVCAPKTTIKIVVSGTAQTRCLDARSQKSGFFFAKISRFVEAHRDISQMSRFPSFTPESPNPYFCSVFGTSRSGIVEKCTFLKTSKNQGQKKKLHYRHICHHFLGNPYFCSVFEASKKWGSIKLS